MKQTGQNNSDLSYNTATVMYLLWGSLGGGLASAIGLGGGVVFNPVLIGLGVPPTVAASTGMYMITFSSFLNTVSFYLFGMLPIDYALWIGLWSGLGIYTFLAIVGKLLKRY